MRNCTRKNLLLSWLVALSVLLVMGLSSCEGPEGPQGPEGPEGPQGQQGPAGTNGIDGVDGADGADGIDMTSSACTGCHNDDVIIEKRAELDQHDHATMANSLSRGGRAGCGRCHSHENFRAFVETGSDMSMETVTGLNCKSCHTLHDDDNVGNFSYGVLVTDPPETLTGVDISFGDANNTNLCLQCHQPRRDFTAYDTTPADGPDSVSVTSSNAGPHYSQ
ncbi:MAG: collagen-like protein, partial [Calditrichaeota bacterium]